MMGWTVTHTGLVENVTVDHDGAGTWTTGLAGRTRGVTIKNPTQVDLSANQQRHVDLRIEHATGTPSDPWIDLSGDDVETDHVSVEAALSTAVDMVQFAGDRCRHSDWRIATDRHGAVVDGATRSLFVGFHIECGTQADDTWDGINVANSDYNLFDGIHVVGSGGANNPRCAVNITDAASDDNQAVAIHGPDCQTGVVCDSGTGTVVAATSDDLADYLPLAGGTMSGDIDMGSNAIIAPADPTAGTHVGDRDYNDGRYAAVSHAAEHSDGGGDEIDVVDLGSGAQAANFILETDGAGGLTWIATPSGGVSDHGALTGLAGDDHAQYLLIDGTRAMTGDLDMDSHDIYVDSIKGSTDNTDIEMSPRGTGLVTMVDGADNTKKASFDVSGVTAANTRTLAVPDSDGTIALTSDIATHAADVDAHHVKYTDAEAVTAMGALGDANPLNHDRYTDAEAAAKIAADDLYVRTGGDTMVGALNMGLQILSAPADPTNGSHVGDRNYNDGRYAAVTHAAHHSDGGADEIEVSDLAAAGATGFILERDGAGGLQWIATPASGVSDHGALTGLGGDDHTQYVLADGTRNVSGALTFEAGVVIEDAGYIELEDGSGSGDYWRLDGASDSFSISHFFTGNYAPLVFYADTHASTPGDILFQSNTVDEILRFDDSEDRWEFYKPVVVEDGVVHEPSTSLPAATAGLSSWPDGHVFYKVDTAATYPSSNGTVESYIDPTSGARSHQYFWPSLGSTFVYRRVSSDGTNWDSWYLVTSHVEYSATSTQYDIVAAATWETAHTLTVSDHPTTRFDAKIHGTGYGWGYAPSVAHTDRIRIQISRDGGSTWSTGLQTISDAAGGEFISMSNGHVDGGAVTGTIQVKMQAYSSAASTKIDDMFVSAHIVGDH